MKVAIKTKLREQKIYEGYLRMFGINKQSERKPSLEELQKKFSKLKVKEKMKALDKTTNQAVFMHVLVSDSSKLVRMAVIDRIKDIIFLKDIQKFIDSGLDIKIGTRIRKLETKREVRLIYDYLKKICEEVRMFGKASRFKGSLFFDHGHQMQFGFRRHIDNLPVMLFVNMTDYENFGMWHSKITPYKNTKYDFFQLFYDYHDSMDLTDYRFSDKNIFSYLNNNNESGQNIMDYLKDALLVLDAPEEILKLCDIKKHKRPIEKPTYQYIRR